MSVSKTGTYYPKSRQHWRKWLAKNHIQKDAVWLIFYKKKTGKPTLDTNDAIDDALCFGWIDGKAETIDTESYKQYYCKRKPNSTWSKINKDKVEKLIAANQMTDAGFKVIEIAKQNGSWAILNEVEELIIPADLGKAFKRFKGSKKYFLGLSRSVRKSLLQWIVLAKRPETRQQRIAEIAELAGKQQKPKWLV